MDQQDYYKTLQLEKTATAAEIKKAYRRLAYDFHPDRHPDHPEIAEKMKAINEAYAVLSDPDKRRQYDALHSQYGSGAHQHFRQNYSQEDIFKNSDISQVFEEMARQFGFQDFETVFKQFYGPDFKGADFKTRAGRGGGFFFFGGMGTLRGMPKGMNPLGMIGNLLRMATGGALAQRGQDIHETLALEPETARQGGPYAYYHRPLKKKLVVKIPPGIQPGKTIRLAGMGQPGIGEAPPGDLLLKIELRQPLLAGVKRRLKKLFQ